MNHSLHFLRRAIHSPGHQVDWHSHPIHEIVYYQTGTGTTQFDHTLYRYEPRTFAVLPADSSHNEQTDTQTDVMFFCFDYDPCLPLLAPGLYKDHSGGVFYWIGQIHRELTCRNSHSDEAVRCYLGLLLIEVLRLTGTRTDVSGNKQTLYAAKYIEQYYNQKIQLNQLADICGYSTDHFRHVFKEENGMTPTQYIRNIRIDKSKQMILEQGDKNLTAIALDCGFASLSQFGSVFKQLTGQSPSGFAKGLAGAAIDGSNPGGPG
ncbi:MAG: AraC family transcriptional regulator [Paenibacillaceae bacterium]|jgi:AraC family transcriptional activator of pobA|nr:AraC family transcriptional regulator [Paenibacillaceae bacterium]